MIFLLERSRGSQASPADHRSESRLSIPRRGALQRSSSPLPQPSSILKRTAEFVENDSSNGKCLILGPSQLWGAPHSVQNLVASSSRARYASVVFATPAWQGSARF
jgi:hypothetical protein